LNAEQALELAMLIARRARTNRPGGTLRGGKPRGAAD
jgi:hypothetical protein